MLFIPPTNVDAVWSTVVHATLKNELGIAAKVAPRPERGSTKERLICVYTYDFGDKDDVARVLVRLRELDLVKNGPGAKWIYYKTGKVHISPSLGGTLARSFICRGRGGQTIRTVLTNLAFQDAYTYLGISSGNPWGIRASIYSSKDVYAEASKKEGRPQPPPNAPTGPRGRTRRDDDAMDWTF